MSYRGRGSQGCSFTKTKVIAYQTHPINLPMLLGELEDVPVRQPGTDDGKLEQ